MSTTSASKAAVPAVLLVLGVVASIILGISKSSEWFFIIFTGTVMLCGPWLAIASNAARTPEPEDTSTPLPLPATPPPLPRQYTQVMSEAQRRKAEQAQADVLFREEERAVKLLNEARCFYKNEDEQIGPVSFWRVRELIEMDLLTPDVQVIAEGSDYWRTYAEWELIVVPPRDQSTFAKLSKAAHRSCFYLDQGREIGPISLLAIFHYIRSGKLERDVQVRTAGDANWIAASQI